MKSRFLHTKLQSSTLVEVLIGMTILMISVSIVFPMIIKTQKEAGVVQRTHAVIWGNSVLENMRSTGVFEEKEVEQDKLILEVLVNNSLGKGNVKNVEVKVSNTNGRELYTEKYVHVE